MSKWPYYHRVGHVEIDLQGGATINTGECNFKFNVEFPVACRAVQANVSILGLSFETIQSIIAYMPTPSEKAREHIIRIYAGYEETGEELIYTGYIIQAIPRNPPQMWIDIVATNFGSLMNTYEIEGSEQEVTRRDWIAKICKTCGWEGPVIYPENNESVKKALDVKMKDKSISSSNALKIAEMIDLCNAEGLFTVNLYDNIFYVYPNNPQEVPKSLSQDININTGLVGIPEVKWMDITLTSFMTTRYRQANWVNLTSQMIPKANGYYWVYNIKYTGELRGKEWYVIIQARPDAIEAESRL